MTAPARLLLRFLLTIALVWVLMTRLPQYFALTGGLPAAVAIGALITLLNLFVRPILDIVILPVRILAHLLAFIVVNGVFLWVLTRIAALMDPAVLTLGIKGGIWGWLVVALILGAANWLLRELLHRREKSA